MNLHLYAAREKAKFRNDVKFRSGLEMLERAERAKASGQIKDYSVLYCADDLDVVDTVLLDK